MAKLLRVLEREQCIGCLSCMFACSRTWFSEITVEKAALRVRNYAGVEGAFSVRACYGCKEPDCALACPTGALITRADGGVDLKTDRCTGCGECVRACVPKALQWNHATERPIVCHHCGVCVKLCPNAVLGMVEPTAGEAPVPPTTGTVTGVSDPSTAGVK